MENYWLTAYSSGSLSRLEQMPAGVVFDWVNGRLPAIGTAVDWKRVRGRRRQWLTASEGELAVAITEFLAELPGGSAVLHDGDSLSPFPVRIESAEFAAVLPVLLKIPEHHYFLDVEHRWVGVFRLEGDVDLLLFDEPPA